MYFLGSDKDDLLEKYEEGVLVASYYMALGTRSRAKGCRGWGGGLPLVGFLPSWRPRRGQSCPLAGPSWHVATFLHLSALGAVLISLAFRIAQFNQSKNIQPSG